MATHDYVIANASGAAVRADLNNALAAIVTNNSNATEPATTYPYMLWADTTAGQLKLRNAANDEWNVLQSVVNSGVAPPSTPEENQLWFNTDDGRLYIYYNDGSSSQWIDASPDNLPPFASETDVGIAEIATTAEVTTGTDDTRIVTPLKLREAEVWSRSGTTVSPKTAGDDVTTTGDLSAAAGTFSGLVQSAGLQSSADVLIGGTLPASPAINMQAATGYAVFADGAKTITFDTSVGPRINFSDGTNTFSIRNNLGGEAALASGGNAILIRAGTSGGVRLSTGGTSWASASDERLKTDLIPITGGLDKVSTLRSVTGRYISDAVGTSRSFLIAQDVQAVLPEAVDASRPDELGLRYTEVVPLLVSALHDAKDRIEALEAEVQSLKGGN